MSGDEKLLKMFQSKIKELSTERKSIDEKITALKVSYEAIAGSPKVAHVQKRRRVVKKRRTLDKQAGAKTLAFLQERKRPTSSEAVERRFKISRPAAHQRLRALVIQGVAKRVSADRYVATPQAAPS